MLKAIVWVTFLEGIRNKSVYGISLMAGLMMSFTVVLSGMIMRDVGKVATDFTLSSTTFASLLVVLFVGITILSRDIERKTVYLALSRSVPRSIYCIGRFLGLSLLLLFLVIILLAASISTLLLVRHIYGQYFGTVSLWLVVIAHISILIQMLLLTATSIFFSMIASSSFVTFILTTITWMIGSSTQEVKKMIDSAGSIEVSPVIRAVVEVAYYIFPNLALFDLKSVAAHGLSLDFYRLMFSVIYGCGYTIALVSLAVILFKKKELS